MCLPKIKFIRFPNELETSSYNISVPGEYFLGLAVILRGSRAYVSYLFYLSGL